jgi:hypothetical protein
MPWDAVPASDVQWSHGCNVMIENNNPFDCRNFADLMPEMVHFCAFAHPRSRGAGPKATVQNIVYESFSGTGRWGRGCLPGGDL